MPHDENDERLGRLLGFLDQDPGNVPLLRDAAHAALDADRLSQANALFGRLRDCGELDPADANAWAIATMRSGEPAKAAETFASLVAQQPDDVSLKFNLAWSRALAGDLKGARETLDAETVEALPQAAQLDLQLMHQAGEFTAARERAGAYLARFPDYPPILAAVSVLALDIEDENLARLCAEKAHGQPDALTTLATLALGDSQPSEAAALFERSLALNAASPRAWVGLGLAHLLQREMHEASQYIDRGAELFGTHLGSWIAAGWAHLLAGNREEARRRFERVVELDDNFAEGQGALAVVDALDGLTDAAVRRAEIALRLDRNCFSAALAQILITAGEGDADSARRMFEMVLEKPVQPNGTTILDAVARMAR